MKEALLAYLLAVSSTREQNLIDVPSRSDQQPTNLQIYLPRTPSQLLLPYICTRAEHVKQRVALALSGRSENPRTGITRVFQHLVKGVSWILRCMRVGRHNLGSGTRF